jgi:hypothetical protein
MLIGLIDHASGVREIDAASLDELVESHELEADLAVRSCTRSRAESGTSRSDQA